MKRLLSYLLIGIALSGIPSINYVDEKSELYALVKEIDYPLDQKEPKRT